MIWGRYNHTFFSEKLQKYFIYNTFSQLFSEIDSDTYERFKKFEKISQVDNITDAEKEFLKRNYIIINNTNDDFNAFKQLIESNRRANQSTLTIAPTRDCNFICSYCYEDNRPKIYMNDETEDKLIDFIKIKNIKKIHVNWYGGEPTLYFDRIESLTNKIIAITDTYTASMITNGYLLSESICSKLTQLKISKLQITLDGLEKTHNTRRKLVDNSTTFNQIISNIVTLFDKNPLLQLNIRVNVDETNKEEYAELEKILKKKFKNRNTYVHAGYVRDSNGFVDTKNTPYSNCNFDRKKKIAFLKNEFKNNIYSDLIEMPKSYSIECESRHKNDFVIDPVGNLYKCWEDIGIEKNIVGNLKEPLNINDEKYLIQADPLTNDQCIKCKYLPICGGGCPVTRMREQYFGEKTDNCTIYKGNLNFFLESYYIKKTKMNE